MPFRDDFDGPDLDTDVWLPHYLPAWSSRAATRASYRLEDSCLVLDVPVDHPVWLAGDHEPPLRVLGRAVGQLVGAGGQRPTASSGSRRGSSCARSNRDSRAGSRRPATSRSAAG